MADKTYEIIEKDLLGTVLVETEDTAVKREFSKGEIDAQVIFWTGLQTKVTELKTSDPETPK